MEKTNCCLCGSIEYEEMYILRDYGYGLPGQFPVVRCKECGLLYLLERPLPSEMTNFYPKNYTPFKKAIEDENCRIMRFIRRRNISKYRKIVERFSSDSLKTVLDLGCSTGIFLAEMRSVGWRTIGIELSNSAVQYARERFDLDILDGRLIDVYKKLKNESISVVTMWDVLEHTFNPHQTLKILNTRLVSRGIVVLTIPHWESVDKNIYGKYWIGYDAPRHLHVFTEDVLRKLLNNCGFEIIFMRCAFGGYYTTLPSFINWVNDKIYSDISRRVIYRLLNIPGLRYLTLPYDTLVDTIGWGNKLLVVAQKTH